MMTALTNGVLAALSLLALYTTMMTLLAGGQAAIAQFVALWYLMVPLAVGFGVQVGLYSSLKQKLRTQAKAALTAGGTSASVGMLACCAHHATDILPFLGLSAASIFIVRYQIPILLASLAINLVGVGVMVRHLRQLTV